MITARLDREEINPMTDYLFRYTQTTKKKKRQPKSSRTRTKKSCIPLHTYPASAPSALLCSTNIFAIDWPVFSIRTTTARTHLANKLVHFSAGSSCSPSHPQRTAGPPELAPVHLAPSLQQKPMPPGAGASCPTRSRPCHCP